MATPSELTRKPGTIYIVDDEEAPRRSLSRLVESEGWTPRPCDSGATLLGAIDDAHPACIVLDLAMPQASGADVQRELIRRGIGLPVLILSAGGTVPVATGALRDGAFDFLEKPVDTFQLVRRIAAALVEDMRRVEIAAARARFGGLSARELEVCTLLAEGLASKEIAKRLSISIRTVEHHRERILRKTEAANTVALAGLLALARMMPR